VLSVIHTSDAGSLIRVQVPNVQSMLNVQADVQQFNLACKERGCDVDVAVEFDVLSTLFVQA
jgi:hypothetical protein